MAKQNYVHSLDENDDTVGTSFILTRILGAVLIGALVGYGIVLVKPQQIKPNKPTVVGSIQGKIVGVSDKSTFKDQAEGILKEGGIDGEGNFHLSRPGGASQNVYLTSTTVDLTPYINKKVRVWGQTFTAKTAGWLMDVGLIELLQ